MQPIYIVLCVALAIWAGLFAYLWRLDARLKGIERRLSQGTPEKRVEAPMAVLESRPDAPSRRVS